MIFLMDTLESRPTSLWSRTADARAATLDSGLPQVEAGQSSDVLRCYALLTPKGRPPNSGRLRSNAGSMYAPGELFQPRYSDVVEEALHLHGFERGEQGRTQDVDSDFQSARMELYLEVDCMCSQGRTHCCSRGGLPPHSLQDRHLLSTTIVDDTDNKCYSSSEPQSSVQTEAGSMESASREVRLGTGSDGYMTLTKSEKKKQTGRAANVISAYGRLTV